MRQVARICTVGTVILQEIPAYCNLRRVMLIRTRQSTAAAPYMLKRARKASCEYHRANPETHRHQIR